MKIGPADGAKTAPAPCLSETQDHLRQPLHQSGVAAGSAAARQHAVYGKRRHREKFLINPTRRDAGSHHGVTECEKP